MYLGSHAFEKVTARFQVTQLEVTVTRGMEVTVTRGMEVTKGARFPSSILYLPQ